MAVTGKIVKAGEKILGNAAIAKAGKEVYKRKGTIAVVVGALAATAIGYWAINKVRGKKKK